MQTSDQPDLTSNFNPTASVKPILELVLSSLDDDKAEEIVTIDLQGKTSIADYMIVANGRSNRQVAAIAQHLTQRLKRCRSRVCQVEGCGRATGS